LILVDSSVWIEFFTNPKSDAGARLRSIIEENNQACLCGIVLQEVLQGIRTDRQYRVVRDSLSRLPFILTNRETYELAASMYRSLRRRGITVPTVDATLAAVAIQNGLDLYTFDEHFDEIARHTRLSLFGRSA